MTSERWAQVKGVLGEVLETDPSERPAALAKFCHGDPDLRREVEALLGCEARADELLTAEHGPVFVALDSRRPASIGPYRIVRELGRGGMGVVYLGERGDGQFDKRVAIKLITAGRHDPRMERRFRRERQILAQLEHPGIARLLDGGATGEGQPYFIMEYIEGQTLLAYSDSHKLSVSDRLRLFIEVCDAVAYAHQQLIVHRDLKPGNILVNAAGAPQLLDFGLGRLLNADEEAEQITQVGLPMMTPAYASPEQARGEPFTVQSDVYSLGVILYELLVGCRPYQIPTGSYMEMVHAIADHDTPSLPHAAAAATPETAASRSTTPERLRRTLTGDLQRIVAKALAKNARERYAGARELSDDIRRYFEGRPVQARPATVWYRANRLLSRHRVLLPVSLAAILLIVSFALTAWWEARRAERRFQQVRTLAHSVMFELDDAIAKVPGTIAAQELLVRRALDYLQSLARDAGEDSGLQREVALGYERVATVQGDIGESSLGLVTPAMTSLETSKNIMEHLVARSPNDPQLRHDLVRITNKLASIYSARGQFQQASELLHNNIKEAESALKAEPSSAADLKDLVGAQFRLANLVTEQRKYAEAIPLRQHGLDLARKLAALEPGNMEAERDVALGEKRLAALLGVSKRYRESREAYDRARIIDEQLTARQPRNMRAKLDLSFDYSDLGWVLDRMDDRPGALAWHRRALALRQEAAAADPNDFRAVSSVAVSVARIGGVFRRMGNAQEALTQSGRAIALYENMARAKPEWEQLDSLAECHSDSGDALSDLASRASGPARQREFRARALAEYQKALSIFEELGSKHKLSEENNGDMSELTQKIAKIRAESL